MGRGKEPSSLHRTSFFKLVSVIFYGIILIVLITFVLFLFGIANINSISLFLGFIKDSLYSLTVILLFFFIFAIFYTLFNWVRQDEGFTIQPFKIGGWNSDKQHNGQAISDLLIKELLRIQSIHEVDYETHKNIKMSNIARPNLVLPTFAPFTENITYNIANLGTINQGPLSISIGQLLIALKKLSGSKSSIITGSLQNYGSLISLVAWMGPEKARSWEVKEEVDPNHVDEVIPMLIKDLAYKISRDPEISKKKTKAKTWMGFKHYSEALKLYHLYTKNKNDKCLNRARENCLKAVKIEEYYTEPVGLLYTLGTEYFNNSKFIEAEELFKKANELKSNDIDILIGLGTTLDILDKDEEALEFLDKAIGETNKLLKNKSQFNLIEKLVLAYNNRASVLNDLKEYEEALKSLNNALEYAQESEKDLENILPGIYYNIGYIHNNLQEYEKALESLDTAIKLGFDSALANNLKGSVYSNIGDYEASINCFNKAIDLNSKYAEAWNYKGYALAGLGKFTSAIDCFNKAVTLSAKKVNIWENQGLSQKGIEKDKDIKSWQSTIPSKFNYSEPLVNKSYALGSLGRFKEAIKILDNEIKCNPKNTEALNLRGIWLNQIGDLLYEEIISEEPDKGIEDLTPKNKIKFKKATHCFKNAISLNFNNAIKIDPENPDFWNNKGYALMRLNKYGAAINCFDQVIEMDSEHTSAITNKAITLSMTGRKGKAIEIADKLVKDPRNHESYFNKGVLLYKIELYDDAIKNVEKAIELNPDYEDAWNFKGYLLSTINENQKAIECFDEAIQINPNNSENWFNKGFLLANMEKYEESLGCYDKVLKLDKENPAAFNNKGLALSRLDKNEEAIIYSDKAIELNPEYELAIMNKYSYLPLDAYEENLDCQNKLIKINPENPDYWYEKGRILNEMGRYEIDKYKEAIKCFDEAIKLNPYNPDYFYNKGLVFVGCEHYEKSIKCFEKSLKIDQNYEFGWIEKGNSLDELKNYEEAVKCYEMAININSHNPQPWNNKGYVLIKLKEYKKAIKSLDRAIKLDPEYTHAWTNKAKAFNGLRQYDKALECIDKSIGLNPDNPGAWEIKEDALKGLGQI